MEKVTSARIVEPVRPVNQHTISSEPTSAIRHFSINWRGIFAGTAIALLTYVILMSLGLAIGGAGLQGAVRQQDNFSGLGIGSGIWLVVSILISLFAGGYTASRVSGLVPIRVGRIQGLVVSSLFFALMLTQLGAAIGGIGRGLGSAVGAVGGAAGDLANNPQIQSVVDEAIGDLNLRSSPEVVAQGIATRMIRGDSTGARNYLARQAGITPAEADARIQAFQSDLNNTLTEAGNTAARVMQIAGWTLFGAIFLGSLASLLGGGLGARSNLRSPIDRSDEKAMLDSRAA